MATSNSRMTLGSIFAALQTTADTATNTLKTVNDGVGMLNKTVSDAAERQKVRSKLDNAIFSKTLHQDKAQELAESRIAVSQYCKQSAQHEDVYQAAYSELASLLEE